MTIDTRPLRSRWAEYRSPVFTPHGVTDEIRHALLTTGRYQIPASHPTKSPKDVSAQVSAAVSGVRLLGYDVQLDGTGCYVCANPGHVPTPEQWETHNAARSGRAQREARKRSDQRRESGTGATSTPAGTIEVAPSPTNGSHPTRSRGSKLPGPSPALAAMLPAVADVLVVTAVGFTGDGVPFLHAIGADGRRYSCSIDATDAPPR